MYLVHVLLGLLGRIKFLLVAISAIGFSLASVQAEDLQTGPIPKWVKDRQIDFAATKEVQDNQIGAQVLLSDQQTQLGTISPVFFDRQAIRLTSRQGIDQFSRVYINYVPAYQSYTVHHIFALRGNKKIDLLEGLQVTFNRPKSAGDQEQHEGTATVEIFLADIQKGDIVELAYSLTGQNPAYGDHIIGSNLMTGLAGSRNTFRRLLVPSGRDIDFLYHGGHEPPTETDLGNWKELEWFNEVFSEPDFEFGAPVWTAQIPIAFFSDYQSWREVREWAQPLFPPPRAFHKSVRKQSKKLAKGSKSDHETLRRFTGFLKRKVRYVGLEIGRNAYRPFPAETVLKRKYGDCKDQTMLLVTMLRTRGIKAWPALVHSNGKETVDHIGISPGAFDHVIAYVEIDGKSYWVDPTEYLPNTINVSLEAPNYGAALILRDNENTLTPIPNTAEILVQPDIEVTDNFILEHGLTRDGTWKRTATYREAQAKFVANQVEDQGKKEYAKSLIKRYEATLEDIKEVTSTKVGFNNNEVTVTEDYLLPKPAFINQMNGLDVFNYLPGDIISALRQIPGKHSERKTPLLQQFPVKREVTLVVTAPGVTFLEYEREIKSAYHSYQQIASKDGDTLTIQYSYETHQPIVSAEGVETHAIEVTQILEELGFSLQTEKASEDTAIVAVQAGARNATNASGSFDSIVHDIESLLMESKDEEPAVEELLALLDKPAVPQQLRIYFLKTFVAMSLQSSPKVDALLLLDALIEAEESKNYNSLVLRGELHTKLGDFDSAATDYQSAVDMLAANSAYRWPAELYSKLRDLYWRLRNYEALAPVLESMSDKGTSKQKHLRELAVAYRLQGQSKKARAVRRKMKKLGIAAAPIPVVSTDPKYARKALPVFQAQPPFPELARTLNVEGHVIVSYSISTDGTVSNCTVVEAKPAGYFDDAACSTANAFVYFPPASSEPQQDIHGWRIRFTFDLAD